MGRAKMHGQDAASTLLSIRDAALATGLSPKALRRRIERGTLSSVLIGGRRRIPTEDLIRHGLMSGRARWAAIDGADPPGEVVAALVRRIDALEGRVALLEGERSMPAPPGLGRLAGTADGSGRAPAERAPVPSASAPADGSSPETPLAPARKSPTPVASAS